jgi:hypothetical protein
MQHPPRHVVVAHAVFNAAVVIECLFGLVFIWVPFENVAAQKLFFSVLVLLGGSTLVLAAHRTVQGWPRNGC